MGAHRARLADELDGSLLKSRLLERTNREIAERLFVSENTVKTHSSRVFEKLNAKRRTQAVQIAKEAGLIR